MAWGVSVLDKTLNKSFYKLGIIIGKSPGYFIIVPVLLTIICITGYVLHIIAKKAAPFIKLQKYHFDSFPCYILLFSFYLFRLQKKNKKVINN